MIESLPNLPVLRWPLKAWANVSLTAKMSVLVAAGIVALVTIFGFLTVSAARETTDRALQERVIMAQLAASHLDHVLGDMESRLQAAASQTAAPSASAQARCCRS